VLAKLFMAPSVVAMLLVALFPVLYAVTVSLYTYTRRQREEFGGLANYIEALTSPRFWDSIQATLVFTVTSVSAEFVIGMVFALIMNDAFRGRGMMRATILIPWIIPTVIAGQMWFFMFNVTPGFINNLLGIGDFNWLGQSGWAMFTIVFADVWKTAPFVALLLLAGMQVIDPALYDSAKVDGASAWRRFWHVTLPLLKPAIFVALLFRTVDALRIFDLPQVMTQGAFGTETVSVLVHRFVVQTPDPGYGSALSTLTFVLVFGLGLVFVRLIGRDLVANVDGGR
jgi:multiple sugar transport system permease protein